MDGFLCSYRSPCSAGKEVPMIWQHWVQNGTRSISMHCWCLHSYLCRPAPSIILDACLFERSRSQSSTIKKGCRCHYRMKIGLLLVEPRGRTSSRVIPESHPWLNHGSANPMVYTPIRYQSTNPDSRNKDARGLRKGQRPCSIPYLTQCYNPPSCKSLDSILMFTHIRKLAKMSHLPCINLVCLSKWLWL